MPKYFIEKLYYYDYDEQEKHESDIVDQTKDLNYKNHNWLTNTRFIGFMVIFYFIKLILMICCCKPLSHLRLCLCPYRCRWIGRFYYKYWLSLIWTEILTLLIAGYLVFLVSGYLNSNLPLTSTHGETLATVVGQWI